MIDRKDGSCPWDGFIPKGVLSLKGRFSLRGVLSLKGGFSLKDAASSAGCSVSGGVFPYGD